MSLKFFVETVAYHNFSRIHWVGEFNLLTQWNSANKKSTTFYLNRITLLFKGVSSFQNQFFLKKSKFQCRGNYLCIRVNIVLIQFWTNNQFSLQISHNNQKSIGILFFLRIGNLNLTQSIENLFSSNQISLLFKYFLKWNSQVLEISNPLQDF